MSPKEERRPEGGCPRPWLPLHGGGEAGRPRGLSARGKGGDLRRLYALEGLLQGRGEGPAGEAEGLAGWHALMKDFIAENREAFSAGYAADACALLTGDSLAPRGAGRESAAAEALRAMAQSKAAVMPRMFSEIEREDARADILACPLLVLPGCRSLAAAQEAFLLEYERAGGRIQAHGDFALGTGLENRLMENGRFLHTADSPYPEVDAARFAAGFRQWIKPFRSFTLPQPQVYAHPAGSGNTLYLHLLNYDYEEAADRVRPVEGFFMSVKGAVRAELLVPGQGQMPLDAREEGGSLRVAIKGLPLYALLRCALLEQEG